MHLVSQAFTETKTVLVEGVLQKALETDCAKNTFCDPDISGKMHFLDKRCLEQKRYHTRFHFT